MHVEWCNQRKHFDLFGTLIESFAVGRRREGSMQCKARMKKNTKLQRNLEKRGAMGLKMKKVVIKIVVCGDTDIHAIIVYK